MEYFWTLRQWILLFLCSYISVAVNANDGYLVTHPLMIRPNTEERISVTIFEPTQDIKVQVRLLWRDEVVTETEKYIFGKGFLTIQVPGNIYGRAKVEVCGNCELGATGFHFKNSTMVDVSDKSASVFIQIDKPVYKPGQEVLINFILTGPDLRPREDKMIAYILDPQGSRMIHWKNLKSVCCGIMNITFPLSDQPVLGEWTIFAQIGTRLYNKTFEVKKYVVPRFEVLINPPSYIEDISKCATATVTARYTYGKPVEGKLSINMNLHGVGYYDNYGGQNNYMFMDISGTASFDICINSLLTSKLKPHFRGLIRIEASVTSNDGNAFTAIDESCLVHKQLVSLKFSSDTREHYKPGLPYFGKAEVSYPDDSPANDISVRVRAEVNEEIIFTQDYLSSDGVVEFDIPTLPVGSGLVWLDARILAIKGVDVSDTYFSTYQSLGSWYSPSHCHILLRDLQPNLKVGDSAMVGVLSTCPCNFTYHYEVMSRGNILTSGTHRAFQSFKNKRSLQPLEGLLIWDDVMHKNATIPAPSDHCETVFSFEVTHAMVPMSRLLVYYVLDNDEGVADSLTLPVEPSFENQVRLPGCQSSMSRNETRPNHKLSMIVSAKPGSCVCVATVDRSVQLLKPGYQLTPEKIFQEMGDYDISAETLHETHWWPSGFTKRRKRSSLFRTMRSRDAQYAFREAGLKVMTDKVHLIFPEQDLSIKGGHWMEQEGPGSNNMDYRLDRHRESLLPETWMWLCFNLSATKKEEHIHVHVPDSITTWTTDVLAFSKTHGLGVAKPASLTAFKDFFVELTLPYSVIRGEQLRVPVTVYNYMDFCVQLSLNIHLQDGVRFLGEQSRSHAKKLCLQAGQVLTTHVVLVFSELGEKKILAGTEAYYSPNCCDGPISEERVVAIDKITQNILVEAEGIPRGYAYSVFFCPNERIHISTPNMYEYQFVKKPAALTFMTFLCKAKNDATIGLARNHDAHELYEIVLGGWDNSMSWIARSRMGDQVAMAETPKIVSWDEFRAFWITWESGEIKVGHGEAPTNESVILSWQDDDPLVPIEYIGFSTGMGSIGEFRIWRKEEDDEAYSEAFTLTLPLNFVPGSERAVATIIGDVMGPTLNNLHNLIRLPFGCGEQNMIHFAPIVYVIGYLKRTNQLTTETETEAKTFLVQGYQRQLTYKRYDGSYSAFGESDSSGSMWLTAFVLKSFAQSRAFIYIDPRELEECKHWIVSQQEVDGSFPPIGRVLNKDIQGGVQGKVSLTAYVLVALLEAGLETMEEERAVTIAQQFLEDNIETVSDPYTAALVAYALTVQSSIFAPFAVRILSNLAIRKEGLTYWRLSGQPLDTLPFYMMDTNIEQSVSSAEVEMTAYALLTYTAMGDIAYSLPIVKWLTQQRNSLGGFSSTQDTCVALQALSEYATLAYVGHVNLNISLAYSDMTSLVEQYYHLNDENSQILQVIEIPVLSKTLFLGAYGEGCGLMQIDVNYNIPDPTNKPSFKLNVNLLEEEDLQAEDIFPPGRKRAVSGDEISNEVTGIEQYKVVIETCTRWLHAGSSNMAVVEVSLLSGFTAGVESLERVLLDKHSKVKRYELKGRKVILYFDEIPSQCMTCIRFDAYREHAVGKLSSVPVKVYDYYEPHFEAIKFYNVSRESPLSGELCEDDRECNQVEDQDMVPAPPALQPPGNPLEDLLLNPNVEQCNSLDGDCITPADMVQCLCERTCLYGGSKVCGSDGIIYENYCMLEVAACQMNMVIRTMPFNYCPEPPEVTTMETPQYPDVDLGSGSDEWTEWPPSLPGTAESIVHPTLPPAPGNFPSEPMINSDAPVVKNPELPDVSGLPSDVTLPPLPSIEYLKTLFNMNKTLHEAQGIINKQITDEETDGVNVDTNEQMQKLLEDLVLPSTTQVVQEAANSNEQEIADNSKLPVDLPDFDINTNTSSQTEVINNADQQVDQDVVRDPSRTEMKDPIAQVAATNETLTQDTEHTVNENQNEKVINGNLKAWLAARHDGNVHDKSANEVVSVEVEEDNPTEAMAADQVTDHMGDHVTSNLKDRVTATADVTSTDAVRTQTTNDVLKEEKGDTTPVESVPSDKDKQSNITNTQDVDPNLDGVKSTEPVPVQPTEHHDVDHKDQLQRSRNQSQEQSAGKQQNYTQDREEDNPILVLPECDDQDQQHQHQINTPTNDPDLQNSNNKEMLDKQTVLLQEKQDGGTSKTQSLDDEQIPVTQTQDIEDVQSENKTIIEVKDGVSKKDEEEVQTIPSDAEVNEDGASVDVTEPLKHAGGPTVKPSTSVPEKMDTKFVGTTEVPKSGISHVHTAQMSERKDNHTESSNQSGGDLKPTSQTSGCADKNVKPTNQNDANIPPTNQVIESREGNVTESSNQGQEESANHTSDLKQNDTKLSNQDPALQMNDSLPSEPPSDNLNDIKTENVSNTDISIETTSPPIKETDMGSKEEHVNHQSGLQVEFNAGSHNLLNSPLTDLDTMVNDQAIAERMKNMLSMKKNF
ncbi:LOW QUALITY PROTEIN: C3 and PZP-like alpha-2-macroglobulin domain-containing protein 8 [Amphiura filiformis]|uniref:LOW QUALITY PROTEIN: C3 and PZP-like alpha-2-macroglobulin domain-containing protein 8 n=1 Tax=Amphiura filiformis TaxID=82378 RepID=UPI003B216A03